MRRIDFVGRIHLSFATSHRKDLPIHFRLNLRSSTSRQLHETLKRLNHQFETSKFFQKLPFSYHALAICGLIFKASLQQVNASFSHPKFFNKQVSLYRAITMFSSNCRSLCNTPWGLFQLFEVGQNFAFLVPRR